MQKQFLHVGCGSQTKHHLKGFASDNWQEIRFDINPEVQPDIIGTLTDMHAVPTGSVDAIYSSHNIEHVFPHEVILVLKEFHRVLKDDGFVVITCPDLQSVCEAVVKDKLLDPLYVSPAGPISPIDILYGHRGFIANGNTYMAHKCGFTLNTISSDFQAAEFITVFGLRRPTAYDLWLVVSKQERTQAEMRELATKFFP